MVMTRRQCFWIMAGMACLFLFPCLGLSPFHTKGESREATVALSMLLRGDWVLPVNNGVDIPYKPPFFQWCVAAVSWVVGGVSEYTARFPSAVALAVTCLASFLFFARRGPARVAFLAALITLTNFELHRAGTNCRVDMLMSALMVLALFRLYRWQERGMRSAPWLATLLMSLAFLTKGPVGVALPCLVTLVFLLLRGWSPWPAFWRLALVGIGACLLPALWYWAAWQRGGEAFLGLVMEENVYRLLGKMSYESHVQPAYYNLLTLLAGFTPYTLLLLFSLPALRWRWPRYGRTWRYRLRRWLDSVDPVRLFSLVATVVIFVFYCLPKSKRSVYLLPIYPFIAYFLAVYLLYLWRRHRRVVLAFAHVLAGLSLAVLALFACMRAGLFPESLVTGRHAGQTLLCIDSFSRSPLGAMGWLSLLLLVAAVAGFYLSCLRGRFRRWGLSAMFALVFALYLSLDGCFTPMVARVKTDRPVAERIAQLVPRGKLYSTYPARDGGDPMRQFTVNFYLGDRLVPFDASLPREGFLICGKDEAEAYLRRFGDYRCALVYDSRHRGCDDKRWLCLYHFEKGGAR